MRNQVKFFESKILMSSRESKRYPFRGPLVMEWCLKEKDKFFLWEIVSWEYSVGSEGVGW